MLPILFIPVSYTHLDVYKRQIQAGADSIYFGIENLNMRARSANTFTIDDLREIAQTCDEHLSLIHI